MTRHADPRRAMRYNDILDGLNASYTAIGGCDGSDPTPDQAEQAFQFETNSWTRSRRASLALRSLRGNKAGLIEARRCRDLDATVPIDALVEGSRALRIGVDVLPIGRARREPLLAMLDRCVAHFAALRSAVLIDSHLFDAASWRKRADGFDAARLLLDRELYAFRLALDALPVGRDIRARILVHLDAHIAAIDALARPC